MAIISVVEFEAKVFQLEQIVIRVRVSMNEQVEDYDYERMANGRTTVANWLETRVIPKLGDREVSVIDGRYQQPHGLTQLQRLRQTYVEERISLK